MEGLDSIFRNGGRDFNLSIVAWKTIAWIGWTLRK